MSYQPKSYNKFLAGAATAAVVASAVVPVATHAAEKNLTDVKEGSYYAEAVNALAEAGVIKGYEDGTFRPNNQVTRAEVAKIIAVQLGLDTENAGTANYSDAKGHWANTGGYLAAVAKAGIMKGDGNGTFRPNAPLTRAEMASIVVRAYDLQAKEGFESQFKDLNAGGAWAADAIKTLEANGYANGIAKGQFGSASNVKRADVAVFLFRVAKGEAAPTVESVSAINNIEVNEGAETVNLPKEVEVTLSNGEKAQKAVEWDKKGLDLNKPGEYTLTGDVADTDLTASVKVVVKAVDPEVTSVNAVNGTKLEVKFNKAIDKNTISMSDFIVKSLDGKNITSSKLVGTLSADGKTYTIETSGGEFFSKRYDVTLADKSVKSTDGKDVAKYETTINVNDKTAPVITETTVAQAGAGKVSVTVKFDEQVSEVGTVSVDGKTVEPTLSADSKSMTINALDAGKTYKIDVVGAKDVAGNIANQLSTTVSTVADNVAPTAQVSVDGSTIKLDFSEEVQNADANAFAVKVNGTVLTAVQDSQDKTVYTVDASSVLAGSTFLNNAKISVSNIYDLAGNKGQDIEVTANLTKDTTAPKFLSASAEGDKLVLKYDEAIKATTAKNIEADDLQIKFVDKDGVQHTLDSSTDFSATSKFGYDLNGNGKIDANDEQQYVVVTLTDLKGNKFITSNKLVQGTYTVTVAKDQLTDAAGNKVAASTFNVVVDAGSVSKAVTYLVNTDNLANNQFKVVYSEAMSNDALNASNYTLGGAALPSGTTLVFVDNKQNVLVTLPEGSISVNGKRVLTVSNVTAANGDTLNTDDQQQVLVDLKENVAPVANKVTILNDSTAVVDFSESVTGDTTGIKVLVNGVEVTPTSLSVTEGDLHIIFKNGTLKSTDKVTVELSKSVLADDAGNTVKDGSVNN